MRPRGARLRAAVLSSHPPIARRVPAAAPDPQPFQCQEPRPGSRPGSRSRRAAGRAPNPPKHKQCWHPTPQNTSRAAHPTPQHTNRAGTQPPPKHTHSAGGAGARRGAAAGRGHRPHRHHRLGPRARPRCAVTRTSPVRRGPPRQGLRYEKLRGGP